MQRQKPVRRAIHFAGAGIALMLLVVLLLAIIEAARSAPRPDDEPQDARSLKGRIDGQQKELDRIRRQIETHRKETSKLKKKETALARKLANLDKDIDLTTQLLRRLGQQEGLLTEQIDSLSAQIVHEDSTLAVEKTALARRLRQMYKRDPSYRWSLMLASGSVEQAVRRYKFQRLIAEQDAALIDDVLYRKLAFERETAEMTEALSDIALLRQTRQEEADGLKRSKRDRRAMLARIRSKKTEHTKAIAQLNKAQEELKDLIGKLEERRLQMEREGLAAVGDFVRLKGKLLKPVDGPIKRGFGKIRHPKFGTVTFNNGVDIGAAAGSPIRAVARGVVEFVDWIDAYGKCIILNHGGGYYTLYAHVSQTFVSQGQQVEPAAVIAEVGNTGSLEGFVCHFELRKSKQALDPTEWFAH